MLRRFHSVALETRLSEDALEGQIPVPEEPEWAYDAAQYFVEDVADPWRERGEVTPAMILLICI